MQNLFRLRVDADAADANPRLTFVDDGGPEHESSLAVLVDWPDAAARRVLEPVFETFVRDYRDAGSIVSPGSFLEKLVHGLDAALQGSAASILDGFEFGVALCCGRGLYLLHTAGYEARCTLDGVPQPLASTLRVRVKDLSPSTMRGSHVWNPEIVERLRLLRVFFEDEDRAALCLGPMTERGESWDTVPAAILVDKEPAVEAEPVASAAAFDSSWPDLEGVGRRDRRTLALAALGLVVVVAGAAVFGLWRSHRAGSTGLTGADVLFSESVDGPAAGRTPQPRVSSEEIDADGVPVRERDERDKKDRHATAKVASAPGSLNILWSKQHSDWVTSSPRLARGRVVYGCRDGRLYARNPEGEVAWEYDSGAGIGATPAVDDGRVFCGNYGGRAFALRDKDGKELWSVELGGKLVASPAAGKKHVFFSTQAGEVVAVQKKNGEVAWRHAAGGKLRATPLAQDDVLYAPGAEGSLVCFKQSSGDVRWTYDAGSPVVSSPLLAEGRLVFGCKDGSVHAVAAKDGAPLWNIRTKGAVQSTPAYADGVVYVGSSDRRLYAVRLKTGDVVWNFPTKAAILASPTIQDGKVYITAYDQHTYVLDAETGATIAKARLKAPIYSSPLVASGRIYLGSNDGTLYCLSDARR